MINPHDIQGFVCDTLNDAGIAAWRNRLPAGHVNTAPAARVVVDADGWHQSGGTRLVEVTIHVYCGTARLEDLRAVEAAALTALMQVNTADVATLGAFRTAEPPPEPDTGWITKAIRFQARVKER